MVDLSRVGADGNIVTGIVTWEQKKGGALWAGVEIILL